MTNPLPAEAETDHRTLQILLVYGERDCRVAGGIRLRGILTKRNGRRAGAARPQQVAWLLLVLNVILHQ